MAKFDLKPLSDPRRGLPSEPKAVRRQRADAMRKLPGAGRLGLVCVAMTLFAMASCSRKARDTAEPPQGGNGEVRAAGDFDRLQGVWACDSLDTGNPRQPVPPKEVENLRIHIQGNRMGIGFVNGPLGELLSYQLQETVTPKVMVVTYLGKDGLPYSDRGPGVKKEPAPSREWLYKFDGDQLVLAKLDVAIFSPPCPRPGHPTSLPAPGRRARPVFRSGDFGKPQKAQNSGRSDGNANSGPAWPCGPSGAESDPSGSSGPNESLRHKVGHGGFLGFVIHPPAVAELVCCMRGEFGYDAQTMGDDGHHLLHRRIWSRVRPWPRSHSLARTLAGFACGGTG